MKHTLNCLLLIALCAIIEDVSAQTPGAINFQGVARNKLAQPLINDTIALRFLIRDSTATGPIVHDEARNTTTDSFGVFNVEIGAPEAWFQSGNMKEEVNWSDGKDKFLQVLMDTHEDKNGFLDMGTTQLISVPFSFYSDVSDSARISAKADSAKFSNSSGTYFFRATMPPDVFQPMASLDDSFQVVQFPRVLNDEGNVYDSTTSTFTAPEDGIYQFDFYAYYIHHVQVENSTAGLHILFNYFIKKNNTLYKAINSFEYSNYSYFYHNPPLYKPDENPDSLSMNYPVMNQTRMVLIKGDKVTIRIDGFCDNCTLNLGWSSADLLNSDGNMVEADPAFFAEFSGYKIK